MRSVAGRGRWVVSLAVCLAGLVWLASLMLTAAPSLGVLMTLAPISHPDATVIAFADAGGAPAILTERFSDARSPAVAYDGAHFAFVGRPTLQDPPGLYGMTVGGRNGGLITPGNGDPGDPAWLPDGRLVYSDRAGPDDTGPADPRALFAFDPATGETTRLTRGRHRDTRPAVRPDGLLSFERQAGAEPTGGPDAIMTIRPDGTGITLSPEPEPNPMPGTVTAGPTPAGYTVVAVIPAAPHHAPPVLTSVVKPGERTGTLLCLDVRSSRLPGIASLPADAIATVRVSDADAGAGAPVLVEAPVHPDGSFFVEVPADTSLRLTLVGRDGRRLASLESGIWVRPNENRGCIGCHEERDRVPENRTPLALQAPPAGANRNAASRGEKP